MSTKKMVAIALFAAMAVVLMWFPQFPLIPAAPYLQYDFSDVPILIGAFSLGPAAGFFMTTVKNLIYFVTKGKSGLIGTFMNWSTTLLFILPAALIYHKVKKSKWSALLGMLVGTIIFTIGAVYLNIYVALPIWGIPTDNIIPLIKTAVIPFNLLRGAISTLMTMLLYRRVTDLIRGSLKLDD
ncbi:MAG: ECF transporter S component [Clostridia bacterium]